MSKPKYVCTLSVDKKIRDSIASSRQTESLPIQDELTRQTCASHVKTDRRQRESNALTSRHEVVTEDGHAEVARQGGERRLDPWEFLGEARGFSSKVAESAEAKYAVWMVAEYVVPAWQQVVGFN